MRYLPYRLLKTVVCCISWISSSVAAKSSELATELEYPAFEDLRLPEATVPSLVPTDSVVEVLRLLVLPGVVGGLPLPLVDTIPKYEHRLLANS